LLEKPMEIFAAPGLNREEFLGLKGRFCQPRPKAWDMVKGRIRPLYVEFRSLPLVGC
jgi:hypothetical protein